MKRLAKDFQILPPAFKVIIGLILEGKYFSRIHWNRRVHELLDGSINYRIPDLSWRSSMFSKIIALPSNAAIRSVLSHRICEVGFSGLGLDIDKQTSDDI